MTAVATTGGTPATHCLPHAPCPNHRASSVLTFENSYLLYMSSTG
ncbi:hypothetical protein [Calothrix sp. FACHB-168]|nr:hypothetical protein [Calothrix sp. FACHB-168]